MKKNVLRGFAVALLFGIACAHLTAQAGTPAAAGS